MQSRARASIPIASTEGPTGCGIALPMQRSAGEIRARRRTRRAVMAAYYAVMAIFIIIAAGNVTWQIWSPRFRRQEPLDCAAGLEALKRGVARARQAAGELSDASED